MTTTTTTLPTLQSTTTYHHSPYTTTHHNPRQPNINTTTNRFEQRGLADQLNDRCANCGKVRGDPIHHRAMRCRICALRGMVELCSVELKLSLFPEEVSAVAAVLNRDHYRFGLPPRR